jgi:hypothetical protein
VTDQDPRISRPAATRAAPAQTPAEASDPVDQVQGLAELREQGVLTADEFTAEKQKILRFQASGL